MSNIFDRMAGLAENDVALVRSPLKTIAEAGGGVKADASAGTDYGATPPPFKHGSSNTRFRATPKPEYGGDGTMGGDSKIKARALRTSKPA